MTAKKIPVQLTVGERIKRNPLVSTVILLAVLASSTATLGQMWTDYGFLSKRDFKTWAELHTRVPHDGAVLVHELNEFVLEYRCDKLRTRIDALDKQHNAAPDGSDDRRKLQLQLDRAKKKFERDGCLKFELTI